MTRPALGFVCAPGTLRALMALMALAATGQVASGQLPIFVWNTNDAGAGSLREALATVNSGLGSSTIQVTTVGTITLQSPLPVIDHTMTILGNNITVSGNNQFRVFFVRSGTVSISDLTIAGGLGKGGKGGDGGTCNAGAGGGAGWGGGLTAVGGTITLNHVTFLQNHAVGGAGGASGGGGRCQFGGAGGGGFFGDGQNGGDVAGTGGLGGQAGGTPGGAGQAGTGGGGGGGATTSCGRAGDGGELGGGGGAVANCIAPGVRGGNGGAGGGGGGSSGDAGTAGLGNEFGGNGGFDGIVGGGGGAGTGGALHVRNATITLIDCSFTANSATGGAAGSTVVGTAAQSGQGKGGAIYIGPGATVAGARLAYAGNSAADQADLPDDNNDVYGLIEPFAPSVVSITRVDPSPTDAAVVAFTVVFDLPVTNVKVSDFAIDTTGLAGAAILDVTGSGTTYTVTVSTGSGAGTLRLDFVDDDSVVNSRGVPVGEVGVNNGDFTAGEVYDVDTAAPQVANVSVSDGSSVVIQFTEPVDAAALTAANYALSGSGQGTLAVHPDAVSVAGLNAYLLQWNSGEMKAGGDITITAANVSDLIGNPLGSPDSGTAVGAGVGTGPTVTLATDAPAVVTGAIVVVLTTSEAVQPIGAQALSAGNATVSDVTAVSSGLQFLLTPLSSGDFSVAVPAGAVLDLAGNGSAVSNTITRVFDSIRPTVTAIDPVAASITSGQDVVFTVTFSEPVSGFDTAADVSVQINGVSFAGVTVQSVSALQYTVTLTQVTGTGTCALSIPDGVAQDAVGNLSLAFGPSGEVTVNAVTDDLTSAQETPDTTDSNVSVPCGAGACGAGAGVTLGLAMMGLGFMRRAQHRCHRAR